MSKKIMGQIIVVLVASILVGVLGYVMLIRENQLKIEYLAKGVDDITEKVTDLEKTTQSRFDSTIASISNIEKALLRAFPRIRLTKADDHGNISTTSLSPLESAVILSASDYALAAQKVEKDDSKAAIQDLKKAADDYGTIVEYAVDKVPAIAQRLHLIIDDTITISVPDYMKTEGDWAIQNVQSFITSDRPTVSKEARALVDQAKEQLSLKMEIKG